MMQKLLEGAMVLVLTQHSVLGFCHASYPTKDLPVPISRVIKRLGRAFISPTTMNDGCVWNGSVSKYTPLDAGISYVQ